MRTRSQTRNRPRQQVPPNIEPFNLEEPIENQAPLVVTMADQRIMAQLLQVPTEGYEDAIVVPVITADNFELKHGLLTLVQNKPFCGLDKEDPHAHIRYFNKITSTPEPKHAKPNDQFNGDAYQIHECQFRLYYGGVLFIARPLLTESILKAITTRSRVSYDGPKVPPPPSSLPKVVEHEPEVTKDTVQPSTESIQPPEVQPQNDEPVVAPNTKPTIPYPSRINKEKLCEKDDLLYLKFMEMFRNLHFTYLIFAPMFRKLLNNKDKIIDLIKTPVNENCSTVILKNESIPPGIEDVEFDPKEDVLTIERLLNSDPTSTLPPEEQKFEELKTVEPSSDELPELELKDLPPHL
ncbi:hypothetical protein Tco_1398794, partial [Tanacetum coccineum]